MWLSRLFVKGDIASAWLSLLGIFSWSMDTTKLEKLQRGTIETQQAHSQSCNYSQPWARYVSKAAFELASNPVISDLEPEPTKQTDPECWTHRNREEKTGAYYF